MPVCTGCFITPASYNQHRWEKHINMVVMYGCTLWVRVGLPLLLPPPPMLHAHGAAFGTLEPSAPEPVYERNLCYQPFTIHKAKDIHLQSCIVNLTLVGCFPAEGGNQWIIDVIVPGRQLGPSVNFS